MDKVNVKDGTILEFLYGTHSYEGVWYGDMHPTRTGAFWWRSILREYFKEQIIQAWIVDDNPLQRMEAEKYYNQYYNQNK